MSEFILSGRESCPEVVKPIYDDINNIYGTDHKPELHSGMEWNEVCLWKRYLSQSLVYRTRSGADLALITAAENAACYRQEFMSVVGVTDQAVAGDMQTEGQAAFGVTLV